MKRRLNKLTKSSISDLFPGSSSEDDWRDWFKSKYGWPTLASVVGISVEDIVKVTKKIPIPGGRKEGDLLIFLKNGDTIYVALHLNKFDPSHHSRTPFYTRKLNATMGVLVAEDVD